MITYENECVGCPTELGCLGSACSYRNVKHLYCDKCNCDADKLCKFDDKELCEDCLLKEFEVIE